MQQLNAWLERRLELPVGALLCFIAGPTAGRSWSPIGCARRSDTLAAAAALSWVTSTAPRIATAESPDVGLPFRLELAAPVGGYGAAAGGLQGCTGCTGA